MFQVPALFLPLLVFSHFLPLLVFPAASRFRLCRCPSPANLFLTFLVFLTVLPLHDVLPLLVFLAASPCKVLSPATVAQA